MRGKVRWFDNKKSFGFIDTEDIKDIFIYYENIKMDGFRCLKANQEVEFELEKTPKGYQAKNVREI